MPSYAVLLTTDNDSDDHPAYVNLAPGVEGSRPPDAICTRLGVKGGGRVTEQGKVNLRTAWVDAAGVEQVGGGEFTLEPVCVDALPRTQAEIDALGNESGYTPAMVASVSEPGFITTAARVPIVMDPGTDWGLWTVRVSGMSSPDPGNLRLRIWIEVSR